VLKRDQKKEEKTEQISIEELVEKEASFKYKMTCNLVFLYDM